MSGIELINPERFAHGTRARYVAGKCRCDACRKANRDYARARAHGEHNGVIDSAAARAHLDALRKLGVGTRAVSAAADVGRTVLKKIIAGQPVRASIVKRVLAVDEFAASDGALIQAAATRKAIRRMLSLGLTRTEIAERLGYRNAALQLNGQRVTARNALRVKRLLAEVEAEVAAGESMPELCAECGESHSPAARLAWLARISSDELDLDVVRQERACWYPRTDAGERKLFRDLAALREAA